MALVNAQNANRKAKATTRKAAHQHPTYTYKPQNKCSLFNLFKKFIKLFAAPQKGETNYEYTYKPPTLEEKKAAQVIKEAEEAKLQEESNKRFEYIRNLPKLSPQEQWEREKAQLLIRLEQLK